MLLEQCQSRLDWHKFLFMIILWLTESKAFLKINANCICYVMVVYVHINIIKEMSRCGSS